MSDPFTPKQLRYIDQANCKYNLAHGAVRSGKTVCTLFRFMEDAFLCPGNSIYIMGYSLSTIYRNIISLLFDSPELKFFAPYCTWSKGDHVLLFGTKKIKALGAGDEGALGIIQGLTIDLALCDEMTLYPENVIDMIDTRLSREHSKLHAAMNPKQPDHKLKQWIDKAEAGNPLYYSLHFSIDDNDMFLPKGYKENLRENLKGLFFKRNFLGQWCMAEGAIFDFFDRKLHTTPHDLNATEYYIAGLDYGTSTVFACVLIAVATNISTQGSLKMRVVKEYYWNVEETKRQKTNSDYLRDMQEFLGDYPVRAIYIDPNAASFKLELQRAKMHVVDGDNEVLGGIQKVSSLISDGTLSIKNTCTNLIREIEGYVWDSKKGENGLDAPVKKADHATDSLRYACFTHKPVSYRKPKEESPSFQSYNKFDPWRKA